jgi:allantoinase
VFPDGVAAGALHLKRGRIQQIYRKPEFTSAQIAAVARSVDNMGGEVLDMGSLVVSPGVIDVHVHMNEPGRLNWEGILTGTSAAVAGGVTTVVDMPLNCLPTITSGRLLKQKIRKVWVRSSPLPLLLLRCCSSCGELAFRKRTSDVGISETLRLR